MVTDSELCLKEDDRIAVQSLLALWQFGAGDRSSPVGSALEEAGGGGSLYATSCCSSLYGSSGARANVACEATLASAGQAPVVGTCPLCKDLSASPTSTQPATLSAAQPASAVADPHPSTFMERLFKRQRTIAHTATTKKGSAPPTMRNPHNSNPFAKRPEVTEGKRLAACRNIWTTRKSLFLTIYAEALNTSKGYMLEEAMMLKTNSPKHWCMHVELIYMLMEKIISHTDCEGSPCPFWVNRERVDIEPRQAGQSCAFGGWQGFIILKPETFLERWAKLHNMHRCLDATRCVDAECLKKRTDMTVNSRREPKFEYPEFALGFEKGDWKVITENLSNQAHRFGLVPLKPGNNCWTLVFSGFMPLVYRKASATDSSNDGGKAPTRSFVYQKASTTHWEGKKCLSRQQS